MFMGVRSGQLSGESYGVRAQDVKDHTRKKGGLELTLERLRGRI